MIETVKSGKYRAESNLKTFISAIAKNIWLNQLKKQQRSRERDKLFESGRNHEESDVSHLIGDRESKKMLREMIFRLDDPCRKILTLFYYENMSTKEITQVLPYESDQVVRNKKSKCLQHLTSMIREIPGMAEKMQELK